MEMALKETTKQLELKFTEPAEAGPAREQTDSGKDYWSDCGQVFFTGGKGYGLTENLRTICLGAESDIPNFFKTGKLTENLDPNQRQVLLEIQEYRQEEGIGIGETDLVRRGNNATSRRNQETANPATPGERLTLHPSHKKHKGIFRR